MSDINLTYGPSVYGRASSTSEPTLGGGAMSGVRVRLAHPTVPMTATGVTFADGQAAGFDRIAHQAQGTSVWRPPDC